MIVRKARDEDAEAIAVLLDQLGYPAPAADVPRRLREIEAFPNAIAVVAEDEAQHVIGLATAHVFPSIHSDSARAWLTSLVVLDTVRSQGVGRTLVAFLETWAASEGTDTISVTSGKQRERTHRFYKGLGYEMTGLRFAKKLKSPTTR